MAYNVYSWKLLTRFKCKKIRGLILSEGTLKHAASAFHHTPCLLSTRCFLIYLVRIPTYLYYISMVYFGCDIYVYKYILLYGCILYYMCIIRVRGSFWWRGPLMEDNERRHYRHFWQIYRTAVIYWMCLFWEFRSFDLSKFWLFFF